MKSKRHRNLFFIASIGFLALRFTAASLFGADRVWTGLGEDDNWSTAANWSTGIPQPGFVVPFDSLTFSGTTRQSSNANLAFGYYAGITFSNGGFTINGPSNPGFLGDITSVGDNTINTSMYWGGGNIKIITNTSGTLTLPAMDFQGTTVQDNSAGTTIFGGALSNTGLLRVFSTGQTVLGGDNSGYLGGINVFRFAKLTHAKGLGGASTTVTLDRSYENAYVDLNGLNVSGVNLSFTAAENNVSSTVARLRNTSGNAASFGGNIALNYTGGVDGDGDTTLNGEISGAGGLIKEGSGTLTLSGISSYAGTTAISSGKLVVNGSVSTSILTTVAPGSTLGGSGTVGAATISGNLAPGGDGVDIKTLNAGTTSWNGGSTSWLFDLSGTPGTSDLLSITGDFTKGTGSNFSFDFQGGGVNGVYTLVTWTGSTSFLGTDFSYANLAGANSASFHVVGNELQLNVIPEPSAWALLVLSLCSGMMLRCRRR